MALACNLLRHLHPQPWRGNHAWSCPLLSVRQACASSSSGTAPSGKKHRLRAAPCNLKTLILYPGWSKANWQRSGQAGILLGAFGNTPQSLMTVQNKIYEGLAMGKAVISGDSPAVRAGDVAWRAYLPVRGDNPAALARSYPGLRDDPELRERLGQNGRCLFNEKFSMDQIGRLAASHLKEVAL
jgi:hypothetical protein